MKLNFYSLWRIVWIAECASRPYNEHSASNPENDAAQAPGLFE